jgi:hypothetical protein
LARSRTSSGPRVNPTKDAAKAILAERRASDPRKAAQRLRDWTFAKQRAFIESKKKFVAACCSRRAGKTYGAMALLLATALETPNCLCLYITLSRAAAKENVWDDADSGLLALNERFDLGGVVNNVELTIRFPNGSRIMLKGVDDEAQADKLRGKKYKLVVIDEAQSFPERVLKALTQRILPMALTDQQGRLVLIGTPGPLLKGRFFEITNTSKGTGWDVHKWTIFDNEKHEDIVRRIASGEASSVEEAAKQILDEQRAIDGQAEDDPTYQREGLGRWVTDENALLYRFEPKRNTYVEGDIPPGHQWRHVMGVDFGSRDDTAFVVWAFSDTCPTAFQVYEHKEPGMHASAIMDEIKRLQAIYDCERILGDPGGGGGNYIDELYQEFHIPIERANKSGLKVAAIELFNSDLINGRVKVIEGGKLAEEWEKLVKDEESGKERAGLSDHLSDAALYSWREMSKRRVKLADETHGPTSIEERIAEEERRLIERRRRQLSTTKSSFWDQGFSKLPDWSQ